MAATAVVAGLGAVGAPPTGAAAEPPAPAKFAASIYIGNSDDNEFSGVVDMLAIGHGPTSLKSAVDEDDGMAVGDVVGDHFDEVLVVDDDEHELAIHDTRTKQVIRSFQTRFDAEEDGLAAGNVLGDPHDEILIADEALSQVSIYLPTGKVARTISFTGFDASDRLLAADLNADGYDEIIVANNENSGRVDAFDQFGNLVRDPLYTGFESGDAIAAGEVTGDVFADIVVANDDHEGELETHDTATGEILHLDSNYDSDDKLAIGDVTGSGMAEILVANTEDKGRIDVYDFDGGGFTEIDSGYDGDDRFAVGTFGNGDIDGDEIPDRVELHGIRDRGGNVVLNLADSALGTSPCHKDIVVEVDYMINKSTGHSHKPLDASLTRARTALDNEQRIRGVPDCPYPGKASDGGIHLIVTPQTDQEAQVTEQTVLPLPGGFDSIKKDHFNAVLDPYVRYNVWVHEFSENGKEKDADGRASPGSDPRPEDGYGEDDYDFLVSITDSLKMGNPDYEASTFIHELGHVMGLRHGGFEDTNCKPNYLSIMNYAFPLGFTDGKGGWLLDFSPEVLDPLVENQLLESAGIGGPTDRRTAWTNGAGKLASGPANGPLNWSGDDRDGNGSDNDDNLTDVPVDLNAKVRSAGGLEDCDTGGASQTLRGYDDWSHLDSSIEPVHWNGNDDPGLTELTTGQITAMAEFWNQQAYPDLTVQLQPQLPDHYGASLGIAMDERHVYALHQYRTVTQPATAPTPGTLEVLDRATMAVIDSVPVGWGPRSVAVNPVTDRIYVVNGGKDSYNLTVIDSNTLDVVDEIDIGQVPIDVEVNTQLNRVYVSNPYRGVIHVINGATNTELEPIPIGPGAYGMAFDESTDTLYAALTRRNNPGVPGFAALGTVVDNGITKPQVLPRVDLGDPGLEPVDVAVDPARDRVFVAGIGAGLAVKPSVTVLDQVTRQQVKRIDMPGPVRAISLNAEVGQVFAAGDRGVEVISADQLVRTRHMDAGVAFAVATETGSMRQLFVGDFLDGKLRRLSYTSGEPV